MKKILVTGAYGQIGTELVNELRKKYGEQNVVASDVRNNPPELIAKTGPNEVLNIMEKDSISRLIEKYDIDSVFHMAALLSATGEKDPFLCWDINMNGTINIIKIAIEHKLEKIFIPSSIAVWGPGVEVINTPQESVLQPTTMYGVTKVSGELLSDYFVKKHNLDIRGLRYPGIISSETLPGGGTTDYAVEIFYEAVKHKKYSCFLKEDATLPMMYMPDCIKATIDLMEADFTRLVHHSNFNVAAMSFSPSELAAAIKKYIPEFEISYSPDYRQKIAESWPQIIDDTAARNEWGWTNDYDLDKMVQSMVEVLTEKYKNGLI
jgi:nucleoside-diphosphate-sugar epimerase